MHKADLQSLEERLSLLERKLHVLTAVVHLLASYLDACEKGERYVDITDLLESLKPEESINGEIN